VTAPLGRAYVQILPDMAGFATKVKEGVSGATRGATSDLKHMNDEVGASTSHIAEQSSGMFTHIKDSIKGLAAFAIPTLGAVAGVQFLKDSIAAARESQKVTAQTNAVLRSTGQIAGVSAKQVGDLSTAISKKTGIDDEAIQSGENLLLTFTNIRNEVGKGNDIFNQAAQAITDLSASTNQSLKSSSIQIGKALNDPLKGITALSRVGVAFTSTQKAQIKALVEGGQVAALAAEGITVTQAQFDKLAEKYKGAGAAVNYLTRQFTPAQKKQFEYYEQGNHLADAQKVILHELHKEFGGSAEAQATGAEKMQVAWGNFQEMIGGKLLPVIDKLSGFITGSVLPGITRLVDETEHGHGIFADLGRIIGALFVIIKPVVAIIWDWAKRVWAALIGVLEKIGPLLERVSTYIEDHAETIKRFAQTVAMWVTKMGQVVLYVAQHAWAALLAVLRAVGPWLLKVVGFIKDHADAFVTFAAALGIIIGLWKTYLLTITLVTKAQLLWTAATEAMAATNPLLIIAVALAALVTALVLAYRHSETFRNIVKAVLNAVKVAAVAFWHAMQSVFRALQTAWSAVWTAVQWAWRNIGRPVWEIIKVAAKVLYAVVGGIFLLIIAQWKALWIAAQWAWRNVGYPVWTAIAAAAKWLWRTILQPVFSSIATAWSRLWAAATVVWHRVIEPIWNGIKLGVQSLWQIMRPVFRTIGGAWSNLWSGMKGAFSSIWGGIETAFIRGINFVIHIINGFIRAVDWILDKLPGNLHINTINTLSTGGGGAPTGPGSGGGRVLPMALGGVTPRRDGRGGLAGVFPGYTPGRDIFRLPQFAFSGGEGILVPEAVKGLGGEHGIRRINDYFMGARGRRASHGGGFGLYAAGGTINGGTVIGGSLGAPGLFGSVIGSIGSGVVGFTDMIRHGVARVLLAALNAAERPVRSAIHLLPDGLLENTVQGGFNAVDRPIRDAILRLGGIARKRTAASQGSRVGQIPTGEHLALIRQALQLAGAALTGTNIADVNTIVNYESGWNPNAINLTDSNAAAGDPSRGLMQTIMSTFQAYRLSSLSPNIYDPVSNLVAGIRYALSRYGSLGNVPGIVSLAHGGAYQGYADGSWNVPTDQTARVHQGEMILPKNVADYIRQLTGHGKTTHHRNQNNLKTPGQFSTAISDAWGTYLDDSTYKHWAKVRRLIHEMIHDLHLHGDALRSALSLEGHLEDVEKRRATKIHEINRASNNLPSNLARYVRNIQHGGDITQVDVPSRKFSQKLHDAAIAQNTALRDLSRTLETNWRQFTRTADDSASRWGDFRKLIRGMVHDLHLHGDALDRIRNLEDRLNDLVTRRVAKIRELTHAQNLLKDSVAAVARIRASMQGRVDTVRGNIVGGFDIASAGAGGTDRFGNPAAISAGTIIGQLAGTVARARQFTALIRRLIREGLPRPLVTQLVMAGPAAMAQAQALANITPVQLRSLRSDYNALQDQGTTLGRISGRYSFQDRLEQRQDQVTARHERVRDLERVVERADRHLVRQFRDALAGMGFQFDGKSVTLVVTQHQSHHDAKGPRR
jgi:SLT domain-containing protein/phage-related protein